MITSSIESLSEYFAQLATEEGFAGFLYESGEDTTALYEANQSPDFGYPCLVLFSPTVEITDNGSGHVEAKQVNSFAVLAVPAGPSGTERNEASQQAQQAAFRAIQRIRTDALVNYLFRIDEGVKWTLRPMTNVGYANAAGWLVDFEIYTSANAQIGRRS